MTRILFTRRSFLVAAAAAPFAARAASGASRPETWAARLIAAAEAQIGVTTGYDPAYAALDYPMGDVPREAGVCTDVVIRAYRDALGADLQKLVHEDMKRDFAAYPKLWGLKRTDRNIDHRRVPNLMTFFKRAGAALEIDQSGESLKPGDLVTMTVPPNLPHIGIVSDSATPDGARPLLIHNIGRGTRKEDVLTLYKHTGRYRFAP